MLLVACVDLDDDLGRKTGIETPVIGRDAVESAAVQLATNDPEDSDVNVLFEGIRVFDDLNSQGEPVTIAAITGTTGSDVAANRQVGQELDHVIQSFDQQIAHALVVTDGAQDESVLPVIRSRVPINGVRRVVVRQSQNLESVYYTIKQVLADPETRGTILVPLGILLLIYPLATLAEYFGLPGAILGVTSALLGLYFIFRGLGVEDTLDEYLATAQESLYSGRVTLVTYIVAFVLLIVGAIEGFATLNELLTTQPTLGPLGMISATLHGAIFWLAAAGITSSLGRITDEYLRDRFELRYLNAPVYVIAITAVLYAVTGFIINQITLSFLAAALTTGTLIGVLSTLIIAVIESRDELNVPA